jgi:hypothetical protein
MKGHNKMNGHPIALAIAISLAGVATGATAYAQSNISFGPNSVAAHALSVVKVRPGAHSPLEVLQAAVAALSRRTGAGVTCAGLAAVGGFTTIGEGLSTHAGPSAAERRKHVTIVESQFDKATD